MENYPGFSFNAFLSQTDAVGAGVLFILLGMSVLTWYWILLKLAQTVATRQRVRAFQSYFWDAPSLKEVRERLRTTPPRDPFSRLAWQAIEADVHHERHAGQRLGDRVSHDEFVTRAMRTTIARDTARLEAGLTTLGSVGSTAPFVGLFGTVWGIHHALAAISASGLATLDKVAGPVGEALVMTALGLAVAIPAVLAYNAYVRANRVLLIELDAFAHDLFAYLSTGVQLQTADGSRGARGGEVGLARGAA